MKGLAELIISFFDLLEAEGQLLRHNALRTLRTAMLLGVGLLFGAAALAFFVAAWRRTRAGEPAALGRADREPGDALGPAAKGCGQLTINESMKLEKGFGQLSERLRAKQKTTRILV